MPPTRRTAEGLRIPERAPKSGGPRTAGFCFGFIATLASTIISVILKKTHNRKVSYEPEINHMDNENNNENDNET